MGSSVKKSNAKQTPKKAKKKLLHVGCGMESLLPKDFEQDYKEVRLDINENVKPDIVSDIRDMKEVKDSSFDALYSSHNLEHVFAHDVPRTLAEFYRVIKPGGFVMLAVPDVQRVCEQIGNDNLDTTPLYDSPAGPVYALDILYGYTPAIGGGNHYMAHKTGFTARSLGQRLVATGYTKVLAIRSGYDLWVRAYKPKQKENQQTSFTFLDIPDFQFGARVIQQTSFDDLVKGSLASHLPENLEV